MGHDRPGETKPNHLLRQAAHEVLREAGAHGSMATGIQRAADQEEQCLFGVFFFFSLMYLIVLI